MEITAPLHSTTVDVHEFTPSVRSHADVIRTFNAALLDLTKVGLLSTLNGRQWYINGTGEMIATYDTYTDSSSRERVCLRFGSWLALAMALKVARVETREALVQILRKHPLSAM